MSNLQILKRQARAWLHHSWSLRTSSTLYIVGGLTVALLGVGVFSHYAISPAEGVIARLRGLPPVSAHALDMTPSVAHDAYATFRYPRGLTLTASQPAHGQTVAIHNWKHNDIQTWRLAISIVDIPTSKITDNNAYLFRKLNPQRFRESIELINGHLVPIMTDTSLGGFNKVGFLRSGRYQAVVSLCGDDQRGQADLQATLSMVLRSWRWQTS